jgi:hypothetical protein
MARRYSKKRKTTKAAAANYAASTSAEAENTNPLRPKKKVTKENLFKLRKVAPKDDLVHKLRGVARCDTEPRGYATPQGQSLTKLVLDASEGFVPLWVQGSVLRWRFQEASLQAFENPGPIRKAIEDLLAEALLDWGDAAPIKFSKNSDTWDFEIIVRDQEDCNINGCVLASAFFPDAGRHDLTIYPTMFDQPRQEQVETLCHEIGHIFGLRHFFAQVSENAFPSVIFGKHEKFTIMNYGEDSKMTPDDRADLKRLYEKVWAGEITKINGTPIKLVKPFHTGADSTENVVALAAKLQPVA